ncbi:hypothetical protein KAN5_26610 [Pseudoalteromonas sp. KAN5]|nr:hypothetical protein KAN5_26610 [Pseudoalteromonas sp. KAN5]
MRISSKAPTLSLCFIRYSQRKPVAHGPEEDAEFTTKNQQRELFYNQPEQAEANEQWQSQLINGYRLWTSS